MKFRTTNNPAARYFDFCKTGRMYKECTFYTDAVRNTTNRECFTNSAILTTDNNAFEDLDTFTVAFYNLYMNFDRVTGAEIGNVLTKLFLN